MQLITDQEIKNDHGKPMVVALGTFDGVHSGHRVIIEETVRRAKAIGALSGVFTFYPHPLKVLTPDRTPGLLTALSQKKRILNELGVDCLILKAFNQEFADTDFRTFVETYLCKYLKIKEVVVGEDFRFGRGSVGNAEMMMKLGKEYGFGVKVFKTIQINGVEIRSTLIRKMVEKGQVDQLSAFLGRPYSLLGKVAHGDGRGKKLGFPTANLDLVIDYVIPAYGVYAVYVIINNQKYLGVANIGDRPTFGKNHLSIEVFILDYFADLYERIIEVELFKKLRPVYQFNSVTELVEQIKLDSINARQILRSEDS